MQVEEQVVGQGKVLVDHRLPAAYWRPISELERWKKNPRVNDRAVPEVARSIRKFGFVSPCVVWESKDRLVAGHTRLLAMDLLLAEDPSFVPRDAPGSGLVPVRSVEFSDEAEAAAYALADNRLSEIATWDEDLLGEVLAEIRAFDDQLVLDTGFGEKEIEKLIREAGGYEGAATDPGPQDDRAEELREKWGTETGQLWEIPSATLDGKAHRLLCGDSTSAEDVRRLMDSQRAALMATDPPYLVDYDGTNHPMGKEKLEKRGGKDGNKHWDAYKDPPASVEFFASFIQVALDEALTDNPAIYQWHASKRQALVEAAWEQCGLFVHQQIIWNKSRAILTRSHFMWQHEPCFYGWVKGKTPDMTPPLGDGVSTIWDIGQVGESDGIHPTQKPLEIFSRPITWHVSYGGLCFEPFSGSGSQLVAAEQKGRICYAMEQAPEFVAAALERLAGMGLQPRQV